MNRKQQKYWDSLSDKQLVEKILANDKEAIEYLFFYRCNGMFGHIIKTVFFFNANKKDLISDFYLHLSKNNWHKIRNFKFNSSLNTWLTVVCVRFFCYKKKNVIKYDNCNTLIDIEQKDLIKVSINEDEILKELSKLELYSAINKLSNPRYRYVLLSELQGICVKEMCENLKCSAPAIYNLTKRAKKDLKKLLIEKHVG